MGALSFLVTVAVYLGARRLYQRRPYLLLSPIFVSPLILVTVLLLGRIDYPRYMEGGRWLSSLLKPSIVAMAVPMYKYRHLLRQYGWEIFSSVLVGSAVALITSAGPALWFHWSPELASSLAPRSVTTPIAMEIARSVGGAPELAAVFVISTALIGLVIGPILFKLLGIHSAVARGALFGMGAHGVGAARAFELGEIEGVVASLAMILAGFATLALTPLLLPLLLP